MVTIPSSIKLDNYYDLPLEGEKVPLNRNNIFKEAFDEAWELKRSRKILIPFDRTEFEETYPKNLTTALFYPLVYEDFARIVETRATAAIKLSNYHRLELSKQNTYEEAVAQAAELNKKGKTIQIPKSQQVFEKNYPKYGDFAQILEDRAAAVFNPDPETPNERNQNRFRNISIPNLGWRR